MDRPLRLITANPVDQLARTVEALLVVASAPLSVEELAQAADDDPERIELALGLLSERFREGRSGIVLEQVAGGYAFRASREAADACARLFERPVERGLSQAALETLSIVAYLGPCSRPEIARIRGVAADSAVAWLLERGLIAEAGRDDGPGGAVRYRTTPLFERVFGLESARSAAAARRPRARPPRTSASGSTRSPSARRPDERQVTVCYSSVVGCEPSGICTSALGSRASTASMNSVFATVYASRSSVELVGEPPLQFLVGAGRLRLGAQRVAERELLAPRLRARTIRCRWCVRCSGDGLQNQFISSVLYGAHQYESSCSGSIAARLSSRLRTSARMSITGLAPRPGTLVLPT